MSAGGTPLGPGQGARCSVSWQGKPATRPALPTSQQPALLPLGPGVHMARPWGRLPGPSYRLSPTRLSQALHSLRNVPGINRDSVIGPLFFHFATS